MTHIKFVTKSMTLYFVISASENITIRTAMHCHMASGDDVACDVAKPL
jgi:predicted HAD superfamily hydrolase